MTTFHPKLQRYIGELVKEFDQIPENRRLLLEALSSYCIQQYKASKSINLIVICTHNSRRSHMGQLWLEAAAHYYGIPNLYTFSGGTEATAFNPRAVKAMKAVGFGLAKKTTDSNPRYLCTMHPKGNGQLLFSKVYDSPPNPDKGFAAILVCTEADAGCPFIPGAEQRFSIPYFDPKAFDDTSKEEIMYAERCREIGREMFFVMNEVHESVLS